MYQSALSLGVRRWLAARTVLRRQPHSVVTPWGPVEGKIGWLRDGQPRTLDEVARVYGITRERIRQIEARGLLKLRQPIRSQRLAEFAEAQ